MRILVVDDDIGTVHYLEALLLVNGHEVWARILNSHDSAEEIVALAALGQFDAATIGLVMPAVSGDQLAPRLRAVSPHMRIIMISCCPEGATLRDLGIVDAYLPKPFDLKQLFETLA